MPSTENHSEATPRVRREEVATYLSLVARRRALEREARDLERQARPLAERLKRFIRQSAPVSLTVRRWGYRLAIGRTPGRVRWADAFVEHCGGELAARLRAEAPPVERLEIEPL